MPKKRYNAEEIIHKLREADVLLSQGRPVKQVSKQLGIAEQTYYRWRKSYGGMKVDQAKRLKDAWFPEILQPDDVTSHVHGRAGENLVAEIVNPTCWHGVK